MQKIFTNQCLVFSAVVHLHFFASLRDNHYSVSTSPHHRQKLLLSPRELIRVVRARVHMRAYAVFPEDISILIGPRACERHAYACMCTMKLLNPREPFLD